MLAMLQLISKFVASRLYSLSNLLADDLFYDIHRLIFYSNVSHAPLIFSKDVSNVHNLIYYTFMSIYDHLYVLVPYEPLEVYDDLFIEGWIQWFQVWSSLYLI